MIILYYFAKILVKGNTSKATEIESVGLSIENFWSKLSIVKFYIYLGPKIKSSSIKAPVTVLTIKFLSGSLFCIPITILFVSNCFS